MGSGEFINNYSGRIRFINGVNPAFELECEESKLKEINEEKLLEQAERFVRDMRVIVEKKMSVEL